jgi:hypothetical protein
MGTLNWRLQTVQTPMAGTWPSHFTTLRLCFGTVSLSGSLAGGFLLGGSELCNGSLRSGDCGFFVKRPFRHDGYRK